MTGLCIIFNHPYPDQITLLRELYFARFPRLLFLHPYDLSVAADDVQVVYGGGFTFESMIANSSDRIIRHFKGCDAVLFLHNDCLLNAVINGQTFASDFDVTPGTILAVGMAGLWQAAVDQWPWALRAAFNWTDPANIFASGGPSVKNFLPSCTEAQAMARLHGLTDATILQPVAEPSAMSPLYQAVHDALFAYGDCDLGYPLQSGYSDFFAVSTDALPKWLHHLGLLASMSLFAEVAVPTAHMLSAGRLVTLIGRNQPFDMLWSDERGTVDNLDWVHQRFADGAVFIHPIKYNLMPPSYIDGLRSMFARWRNPRPGPVWTIGTSRLVTWEPTILRLPTLR